MWRTSCCCVQTRHLSPLDSCHFWTVPLLPVNNIQRTGKHLQARCEAMLTETGCVNTGRLYLNRRGFRDLPQDDDAPLVIRTNFLPLLIHLYHRRGCREFKALKSRPMHMQFAWAYIILKSQLTSQHIQDEVHVSGEDLDALHAGYGPNRDKLVTVHLWHQVQILREVLSETQSNGPMAI